MRLGGEEEEGGDWGGGGGHPVTQIQLDRHPEHVNRHMGRACAALLAVTESTPGAKAHAAATRAAAHTHSVPTGACPAFPSRSAPKEKPESGAGAVNDTERCWEWLCTSH